MYKKWIAWLLCLSLALSLCACGGDTESTEPTTTTDAATESTAPSEHDALALFNSAKEALLSADQLSLSIEATDSRTVGGESYSATEYITAAYAGLQGELVADITCDLLLEDESNEKDYFYTEQYAGGTVYADFEDALYREEISAEDYLARQIPLCLFDAANFGVATSDDGKTLRFSEPVALESWIAPDYAELVAATATAKLENDAFAELSYIATFRQGAADVTVSYKVEVGTAAEVTAEAPTDADSYILIDNVEVPRLVEQAMFNLLATSSKSAQIMQVIASQAAGYGAQMTNTITEYGADQDYKAKIKTDITEASQNGQQSMTTEEVFSDGKYSYSVNGELSDEGELDAQTFSNAVYGIIEEYLIYGDWITEAALQDVGDGYLVEFSSEDQDCMDFYKESTMAEIFQANTALDDMASAYEHKVLSGYIGIDKDTLMLTSYSVDFQGTHTIEGAPYLLSQQIYCDYAAPSTETYKEITGEALPETEPSEKASPVFYHVTGENGEEMWLLGTIHLGDERTGFLPEEIYAAFDASDALAVEFDINAATRAMEEDEDFAQKISSMMVYTDGSTAGDYLYTDTYEEAIRWLQYNGEYVPGIEMMKVSTWQNILANAMLEGHRSLTASKGVDQRLLDRAEAAGKEILNVESMESQMEMLTGFSNELQEYLLKDTLATTRHEAVGEAETLYDLWCAGDEAALREYLKEAFDAENTLAQEYQQALSTNRDKGMVETAKNYLTGGKTVFYAVGLAHLLAENGLVDSLRAAGYTVELVSYAG